MIRFGRLLLFALLALWLPATMHCRLEAAGFFAAHDDCAEQLASEGSDCKDDACPTVEDALFKESSAALAVSAPAECFLPDGFAPAIERVAAAGLTLSPFRGTAPPEVAVTWQFVERTAPPARAPSRLNS